MNMIDGWNYDKPVLEGDIRKIVTLEKNGMIWIGIRAYHHQCRYWINNGKPCDENIIAWRDLPNIARDLYNRRPLKGFGPMPWTCTVCGGDNEMSLVECKHCYLTPNNIDEAMAL